MKNRILILLVLITSLFGFTAYSQNEQEPESLGLPGDNLNLYAVLDIFQNSKTIEDFEKSLNEENTKINNLDLDNDGKVDFIKVITKKEGENFIFILQDEIKKNDIQDVAVIFVNKDKNKKISVQIVGDENLYGKNYVVEPVSKNTSSTVNPAYNGIETITTTTVKVVNVETSPVVVYLYSPVYVPYYPPYYYGFYPPYFHPWAPIYFSMYYHNHYHYHNNYYRPPYHHYPPHYAHYSSNRNTSVVVVNNTRNGNYKGTYNGNSYRQPNNPATRPSTRPTTPSTRPTTPTTRPTGQNVKPSTRPATPTTRQTTPSTRPATPTTRPTKQNVNPSIQKSRPQNTGTTSSHRTTTRQSVQRNR